MDDYAQRQAQTKAEAAARATEDRLDEMVRRALDRAQHEQELAQRIQQMTQTSTSRGREVTVTVNNGGHVTDLRIAEHGMDLSAQELSALICETIRVAGATMGQRVGKELREWWGEDSPLTKQTVSAYDVFGPPPASTDSSSNTSTGISPDGILRWNGGGRS